MMRSQKQRLRTKSASENFESQLRLRVVPGLGKLDLSKLTRQQREDFYAGAKFDAVPGLVEVPVPPMHWMMNEGAPRSQSTPASPVTVYGKSGLVADPPSRVKLDAESLFGTKKSSTPLPISTAFSESELGRLLKSASVPERRMMMWDSLGLKSNGGHWAKESSAEPTEVHVMQKREEAVATPQRQSTPIVKTSEIVQTSSSPEGKKKSSGISGQDLMELLKSGPPSQGKELRATPVKGMGSPSCQFDHHDSADSQYKDITNHLKSILNVSIAA